MAKILFVTWDGGGNLPPALAIAAELRRRENTVTFLGHPQQRERIETAGLRFTPYRHARPWSATEPASTVKIFAMFTDVGPGKDLLAVVAKEHPQLVVIDCMCLGALQAAHANGIRYAVLAHTLYAYLRHRWSRGPVGLIATLHGQRPARLWSSAQSLLVAGLPDIDPIDRRRLPATLTHTGVTWPADAAPPTAAALDGHRILISLSTVHYNGQTAALQLLLDAVSALPVEAIVTTGEAVDPTRLRVPGNVDLHRYLPHSEVMPQVSLVVSHGGHGTAMQALAHNLPLVIMPMHPMLDQPMIGRILQQQEAATMVRRTARPEHVREVIKGMLRPGPHQQAAARLGTRIRSGNGALVGADLIRSLTVADA
ncbi:hypothetical protein GCM10009850_038410 [Nonomuraea monospora]|uniref:Erythromycin biosynthesis protein CIII-like C-terminal domain-containing protein n=1 Tax=Nonomuraea monospora TaxID=568818 RepID=A0ABP5PCV0_9ACTN